MRYSQRMGKKGKLLAKLTNKNADKNWTLAEAEQLLELMGFHVARKSGSHRTYVRPGYPHNIGLCPHEKKASCPATSAKSAPLMKPSNPKTERMKTTWTYPINVSWSDDDEAFVARVPALRHCIGHGDTHEAAVKCVKKMAKLMLASMTERGVAIPAPTVTTERLQELAPVLSLASVAREAKVPQTTLASKLKRNTALTEDEGERLASVLLAHGVAI